MVDLADKSDRVRFVPGQPDMWAFVLFETVVFTAYFGFYLFYRTQSPEAFLHSQAQLDLRIGVFNTLADTSSHQVASIIDDAAKANAPATTTEPIPTRAPLRFPRDEER